MSLPLSQGQSAPNKEGYLVLHKCTSKGYGEEQVSMETGRNNWEHNRGGLCISEVGEGKLFVILLSWCGVGFQKSLGRNKTSCAQIKGVVLWDCT